MEMVMKNSSEINSIEYLAALKEYMYTKRVEAWYYDVIYDSHIDISRFFYWVDYLERFGKITGLKALDIGCGSGGMSLAMLKRGASEVCMVETDKCLCDLCHIRFQNINAATVHLSDGKTLPFDNDSFDIITSLHVIEHVDDIETFLSEVFRVLKQGGRCILECPNRGFPMEPHNKIPFITYLPKGVAHIMCADFLSKLPIFKQDIRLRLKNVKMVNQFISTGKLIKIVNKLGGSVLMKNPEERFLIETRISRSRSKFFKKRPKLLELSSHLFSRNVLFIFRK